MLFGNLQKVSAEALGYSPLLMCAANSSGGVMGKMIDAQSIVVAAVATGGRADSPDAGTVLRAVFWHSIALAGPRRAPGLRAGEDLSVHGDGRALSAARCDCRRS